MSSSSRECNDLAIGFRRSINAREIELTINETTKGIYNFRIYLKDVFGFAEHQDNYTFGMGYRFSLQRNSDKPLLGHPAQGNFEANLALAGRFIIDDIS